MAEDNVLTQDIGPLPAYAWGGAIAAGLALSWWLRRRGGDSPAPENAASVGLPPSGAAPLAGGGSTVRRHEDEPADNREWRRLAFDELVAAGVGTVAADQALSRYLNGDVLTAGQAAIIEQALQLAGMPPRGAPPVRLEDAPPGAAPTPDPDPDPGVDPGDDPEAPSGPATVVAFGSYEKRGVSSDAARAFRFTPYRVSGELGKARQEFQRALRNAKPGTWELWYARVYTRNNAAEFRAKQGTTDPEAEALVNSWAADVHGSFKTPRSDVYAGRDYFPK